MSKTSKIIIGIIVVIIVIGGIWYGMSRKPKEEEVIKIGIVLPLTGELASIGEGQKNAIEIGLLEFKDIDVQLIIEDDHGCQPKDAITAIQKLINIDKVKVIIGSTCSGPTLAMAPVAEENKIVLISPSASSPSITNAGDYVFRVYPADDLPCIVLAKFAFERLKLDKAAILIDSASDASVQEKNYVKDEFVKLGGEIVIEESFKTKDTDFRTQLLKIKNSEAKIVFFSAFPTETGLFLKQAKELGLEIPFISLDAVVENPDVIEIAEEAAEGLIYTYPARPSNKERFNYITKYKEKYGNKPPSYSAEAYDSIMLVVKAIKESNKTKEDIKNKLYQVGQHYMGASGEITFDENGDVQKDFTLKTIKNGQFVPYEE